MREIGCGTAVTVVTGPTGSGKTFLLGLIERACTGDGRSVQRIDRGDLADAALSADCDVLLVDEADSIDQATLQALLGRESDARPSCIVFACRPSSTQRFVGNGRAFVNLSMLSCAEARSFLLQNAKDAGCSNLFDGEALDCLIAASGGSPRLLKSIGSHAIFFASSQGANQIALKHAEDAVLAQFGVPSARLAVNTSEFQDSKPSLRAETVVTPAERGNADIEATVPADISHDDSKLPDPVPDTGRLLIAALAGWAILISAVLYDKNYGGYIYGTPVSRKRIVDARPVTDPLQAMQKVADAVAPRPIVLAIISSAPLQEVDFEQRGVPEGSARRLATTIPTAALSRGREARSIIDGARKPVLARDSRVKLAAAQAGLHTPIDRSVPDEPSAVDRLRDFFYRQLGVRQTR
jgi:hypothetical protein